MALIFQIMLTFNGYDLHEGDAHVGVFSYLSKRYHFEDEDMWMKFIIRSLYKKSMDWYQSFPSIILLHEIILWLHLKMIFLHLDPITLKSKNWKTSNGNKSIYWNIVRDLLFVFQRSQMISNLTSLPLLIYLLEPMMLI